MKRQDQSWTPPGVWQSPDGAAVSCNEKISVLNENLVEIRQMCQDALEDAVLMGADEGQLREVLRSMVDGLTNPWPEGGGK